jgi:hypothetical protein
VGVLTAVALSAVLKQSFDKYNIAEKFVAPQGASEKLEPISSSRNHQPTLVYEGQKEPKCPGDIEKVVPVRDDNGNFRVLNVICKPNAATPAK